MKKTIKNLAFAFIGESQARNRYSFYASQAKKEGYIQIKNVFEETASHENQHAKWLMRMINQLKQESSEAMEEIMVPEAGVPTVTGTTEENLKSAIEGENHEHTEMYPEFAEIAKEEGYPQIAARLKAIAESEEHHEERYQKILEQLEQGTLFKKESEVEWYCLECGRVHIGTTPPDICPSCDHPKGFYQLKCEEF